MATSLVQFVMRKLRKDTVTMLGRWKIDYCPKKLDSKVHLSNEDHCGTCGGYLLEKQNNKNIFPEIISNQEKTNSFRNV